MAKQGKRGNGTYATASGPASETVTANVLMEMLRSSSERTELAMGPALRGGLESLPMEVTAGSRLRGNPYDAIVGRLRRMGYDENQARAIAGGGTRREGGGLESFGGAEGPAAALERIIGRNMLMRVNYLEAGHVASRAVGRVQIVRRGQLAGFGTGFLVSPRLLLSNNHVLPSAEVASGSRVEFDYQHLLDGNLSRGIAFDLDPDAFFVTSDARELDFTLVAVRRETTGGRTLDEFGSHPLVATADEVLAGECVTIVQHPDGQPKQIALRENEVIELPDSGAHFLHYRTDTNPGSSGSPVFNDGWEVVALHHAGKPATDDDGNYLADDGSVWNPDMGLDRIKWVANEGIRVAAIVEHVGASQLSQARRSLFEAALRGRPPVPPAALLRVDPLREPRSETSRSADGTPSVLLASAPVATRPGAVTIADGGSTWTIPLVVNVRLGPPEAGASLVADTPLDEEEAVRIDPNYSNREGYDPEFLGGGDRRVDLPAPPRDMEEDAAINRMSGDGRPAFELPYHHFSIAMNRRRRLAIYTAVNIDGRSPKPPERDRDRWSPDPRIGRDEQVDEGLYARNPFDRGHLVRRLDPAWGRSMSVAKAANDDTFHFTNSSPQHSRFNQGRELWLGLEDYLLNRAADDRKRMTVFTGHIFEDDDPVYRGVQIPRRYWKVAATTRRDGRMLALAFLLSQEDLIRPVVEEVSPEDVARLFQIPVRRVEELTRLDFGHLRDHDPVSSLEVFEAAEEGGRNLESYEAIVL